MACEPRYADAFDYAVIWQCEKLLSGADTAGAGTTLTDATAQFVTTERIEVGMPVYNATTGAYGKVTSIADTTLGTTITWTLGDSYQIAKMERDTVALVETYLRIGAGDINAARSSANACACTIDTGMDMFLRKLNVVGAAVLHNCPCARPNLSDQQRFSLMEWATDMLDKIRTGALELCSGYAGSSYPAVAFAQIAWTDWRAAEIMIDALLRNP